MQPATSRRLMHRELKTKRLKPFRTFLLTGFLLISVASFAQNDSVMKGGKALIYGGVGVGYTGSMIGLYSLWYKDYPMGKFHFFNDNAEWLMMDKAGHSVTAYQIGRIGHTIMRSCGFGEKRSVWFSGLTGFAYLTTVEIFDGFSTGWGASPTDMAANFIGSGLFIGQQLGWHEQKIQLKYSFHNTEYPAYNPSQLGRNLPQKMLKDYNGQTYWLSVNISSLGLQETHFPKWLNLAAGYSIEGLTGSKANTGTVNGTGIPDSERRSQFYISPDIDLSRIKTRSKVLKHVFNVIGFVKIPAPALQFDKKGVTLIPVYF